MEYLLSVKILIFASRFEASRARIMAVSSARWLVCISPLRRSETFLCICISKVRHRLGIVICLPFIPLAKEDADTCCCPGTTIGKTAAVREDSQHVRLVFDHIALRLGRYFGLLRFLARRLNTFVYEPCLRLLVAIGTNKLNSLTTRHELLVLGSLPTRDRKRCFVPVCVDAGVSADGYGIELVLAISRC
ncbi:hypothetical protein F4678DRAFT_353720 [Xylaria arbuscula]|nr:hypothetical protein F4678DRAFT_353720 [Xylaria arbuscula]